MTLTELSRRERKKDETRRRIFEAAVALFRAKGFEETTVDEITERADVGRGTFFNYFPRKEAVLTYLSEGWLEVAEENAAPLLDAAVSTREKVIDIFLFAASAYEQDPALSRFVFGEWVKRGFASSSDAGARWSRLLLSVLEQGKAKQELLADVPTPRAESLLSGVYMATIFEWLFCPPEGGQLFTDVRSELTARLTIVLDGMSPRPEGR